MKPAIKYQVIYKHRNKYRISEMCRLFKVSRSGYYKYLSKKDILDKDLQLANKIEECQEIHHKTYGYRRVHIWLELSNQKPIRGVVCILLNTNSMYTERNI